MSPHAWLSQQPKLFLVLTLMNETYAKTICGIGLFFLKG